MAGRGSYRRRKKRDGAVVWDARIDLAPDPMTGERRTLYKTLDSKQAAVQWLSQAAIEIDQGLAIERSRATVADLLREFLPVHCATLAPNTRASYYQTARLYIIPALGGVPLQKLSPRHVERLYADLLGEGKAPATIKLCRVVLGTALRRARRHGLVTTVATDDVKSPRVTAEHERRIWTNEEARRYLDAAEESYLWPYWLLALHTGMRRGELLGLRWRDIDFEDGSLIVQQSLNHPLDPATGKRSFVVGPPKGRSTRIIPVTDEVTEALRARRSQQNQWRLLAGPAWQASDLVFTTRHGSPVSPVNVYQEHGKITARARVPAAAPHTMRHLFATEALHDPELSIKEVSLLLGHSRTSITTDVYGHAIKGRERRITTVMERAYQRQKEGSS